MRNFLHVVGAEYPEGVIGPAKTDPKKPKPDCRYITDKTLASLKAPPRGTRRTIYDTAEPGLQLVITPKNARSWFVRYQMGRGDARKQGMAKIGDAHVMTPADAREKAKEYRTLASKGIDPAHRPEEKMPEVFTVAAVFDSYMSRHVLKNLRPNTQRQVANAFKNDVLPKLGGTDIKAVTVEDIHAMLNAVIARGAEIQANRNLAHVRKFFRWTVEHRYIAASPVEGIKAEAREKARDRVLSDHEISLFWRAAQTLEYPFGPAFQLLALTLQRREEVCGMRWDELDLERAVWTIPASRAKNGKAHDVHLSEPAIRILRAEDELAVRADKFVFTTTGRAPVQAFSKAKVRLDKAMAELNGGTPVPHWVLHDLRRTGTTVLARAGFPPHVVDKLLNHVKGAISGVAAVYNRHGYETERGEALDALASHILKVAEPTEARK